MAQVCSSDFGSSDPPLAPHPLLAVILTTPKWWRRATGTASSSHRLPRAPGGAGSACPSPTPSPSPSPRSGSADYRRGRAGRPPAGVGYQPRPSLSGNLRRRKQQRHPQLLQPEAAAPPHPRSQAGRPVACRLPMRLLVATRAPRTPAAIRAAAAAVWLCGGKEIRWCTVPMFHFGRGLVGSCHQRETMCG